MDTNFRMIRKLVVEDQFRPAERGVLTGDEANTIRTGLCVNEMDVLQLRNLRDMVVMTISRMQDEYENDFREVMKLSDLCSGITAVIDQRIFCLGGEM